MQCSLFSIGGPLSAENDDIDEIIEMHVDVDPTDPEPE